MEFNLLHYINESMIVLVPVLYVIGMMLKGSRFKDELIPWVLMFTSIIFCLALSGISVQSVIQGVLIAGTTVLGNQLYIQTFKR
ncbi:phage holin family protein [Peptostreptococcus canis]|uniref:Holin n=1 Tax=Peptostreptococcus canis TaxID=1159213 RepID=A0ABR6TMD8_9FIRM|nr:phage holin family protein [Peptostreptococcus canis]MBC2576591.1 hypothetical protein [Peptostreptococcus canis]MBP1998778.1 hypothetical protein [Peptostreptococcus canis]